MESSGVWESVCTSRGGLVYKYDPNFPLKITHEALRKCYTNLEKN